MQPEKKYKYRITAVRQLDSIGGTSYRGYKIRASKEQIERALGIKPLYWGCSQVNWEWRLVLDGLWVFTIYNMAYGRRYRKDETLDFHLGWHPQEYLHGDEFPAIELSRAMEERGLWVER